MVLGLTGGIASGKTTVSNIFRKLNIPIYDADIISRELTEEKEVLEEIDKTFLVKDLVVDRKLNRSILKSIVFENKEKLSLLNKIIHPKVIKTLEKIREENDKKLIIFDIPLLYESNCDFLCDKILVIGAQVKTQIKRVKARDNMTDSMAKQIIDSQMPLEEKVKRADFTIWNEDKNLSELEEEVKDLHTKLLKSLEKLEVKNENSRSSRE
jgi:dephospho-CoA kinase